MFEKFSLVTGIIFILAVITTAEFIEENTGIIDEDAGASREASRTDDQVLHVQEEAIKVDGLSPSQLREMKVQAENFTFQTEVNRMMKLIVNSLYRNKEIFLRELISNASDALDKIRLLSLTDRDILDSNSELSIKIKADKTRKILSITDTGIGMSKMDLVNNLGTIAKSGTAEFLGKMQNINSDAQEMNDMIGQFGVGFYSAFLVANKVLVTSKHNDDKQYIWESDSSNFSIVEDPRGNTLKRGTTISLEMKDEAVDFLETDTIKNLIRKYSQFINFPIYLWNSKTVEVSKEINEKDSVDGQQKKDNENKNDIDEEDIKVEEFQEETKSKKVEKTVWDWELLNDSKPIWSLKPSEITDEEYDDFYKALTKDNQNPLAKIHFIAEGEVTFKSLLFIPQVQPSDSFNRYGKKEDSIKLYVRRVFISDKFNDLLPSYLAFVQGIVDSDDLPLNVSRENLQQHKLIKIIKKKLVRKVLDMIKKISKEDYENFWKEYSTNIKLGIMEDAQNRARLSKLLMFLSSSQERPTTLADYVSRMKPNQQHIYYIAGASLDEVKKSPFAERLLKKNYEVLYLVEAVDEYALSNIPEFDGKKFQNIAKEGFSLEEGIKAVQKRKELENTFEPLIKYLNENLKNYITKAQISERLADSPCALVASMFGWTGNMERLALSNAHQKTDDPQKTYYLNQKKTLEINPRHPLMRELLRRIENNQDDETTLNMAVMMFQTATLRSGYMLKETASFTNNVESLMRKTLGLSEDEMPEIEEDEHVIQDENDEDPEFDNDENKKKSMNDHEEL